MTKRLTGAVVAVTAGLGSVAAAGSIASVSRSETPDEKGYYTLSIEGADFGDGPNMVLFEDFEHQTIGQPVDLGKALHGKWGATDTHRPLVVEHGGGKAMRIREPEVTRGSSLAQVEAVFPEKVSSIFISYSVVVPEGKFFSGASEDMKFPDVSSWKFTWITDTSKGISSRTMFNLCAPTHGGRGSFLLAGNSVNHGWISMADCWSWHTKNYMSFGMIASPEKPKELPGQIIFQLTGKKDRPLIVNKADKPVFPETNTTSFDRVKFPGWFGNGDTSNFNAYYDDIYVATGPNALARVELSDGQEREKSLVNLTLPISEWSATRIRVKVHKSEVGGEKPLFVRVYDTKNVSTTRSLK